MKLGVSRVILASSSNFEPQSFTCLVFLRIVQSSFLSIFDSGKLELVLFCLVSIDVDDWQQNTKYGHLAAETGFSKFYPGILYRIFTSQNRSSNRSKSELLSNDQSPKRRNESKNRLTTDLHRGRRGPVSGKGILPK